jgi:hypothetical protein
MVLPFHAFVFKGMINALIEPQWEVLKKGTYPQKYVPFVGGPSHGVKNGQKIGTR